tara:strand:- start:462 stop:833 length:372 start_codon:yes stop_codon:yes gene_type:complete
MWYHKSKHPSPVSDQEFHKTIVGNIYSDEIGDFYKPIPAMMIDGEIPCLRKEKDMTVYTERVYLGRPEIEGLNVEFDLQKYKGSQTVSKGFMLLLGDILNEDTRVATLGKLFIVTLDGYLKPY